MRASWMGYCGFVRQGTGRHGLCWRWVEGPYAVVSPCSCSERPPRPSWGKAVCRGAPPATGFTEAMVGGDIDMDKKF